MGKISSVKAVSDGSASGLIREMTINPEGAPYRPMAMESGEPPGQGGCSPQRG